MKLIERYIFRRASIMFFATLLPLLGIVWVTQALNSVNLVTDSGQSITAFLKLATLILPSVVPIILPFAFVIAVAQTLTVMNSDSELTVLNAAGSSRMTIIRPVMILGAFLSVTSFAVDNFVEPYSRMAVRQMIATAKLLNPMIETVIRSHSEQEARLLEEENGSTVFLAEEALAQAMVRHVIDRANDMARHGTATTPARLHGSG